LFNIALSKIGIPMEDLGICFQAYIPVRREPDERSEMTSQVLYGERFTILESDKRTRFSLIHLDYDAYEGWIDSKSIFTLSASDQTIINSGISQIIHEPVIKLNPRKDSFPLIIGSGSTIYLRDKKVLDLTGIEYSLPIDYQNYRIKNIRSALMTFGQKLINIPYLWGGRSSFGFDCSGLCQNLYKQVGINLPRNSGAQSNIGKTISFIEEAKEGDLAFFDNDEGRIIHVGMITGKNSILHCSGRVKTDRIDHQGIYSLEQNSYTHRLRIIKNIID
jgi:hypothetical protein